MKSTEKMKNSKPQWSIKLPCLCLIAATMAFTMGLLTAPLLNISAKVISSSDPSRQLIKQLWPDSPTNQVVMEAKTTLQASTSDPSVQATYKALETKAENDDALLKTDAPLETDPVSNLTGIPNVQPPSESDKKKCNIFEGKWVEAPREPLYRNATCPFLSQTQNCPGNGRPDEGYLNWRWQPTECDLPRFDGLAFLEVMRGKTLAFIGDSVTRNQFEALMCALWQVAQPHPNGNRKFQRWVFRDYNVQIIRIWSSWLVRVSSEAIEFAPENMTKLHLKELDDKIAEFLPNFDVLVLASGHWWPKTTAYIVDGKVVGGQGWWNSSYKKEHDVLSGYSVAIKTALNAIVSRPDYKGLTILRTYSPEHYEGGAWNTGGSCTGKTQPLTDKEVVENPYMNTLYSHQMAAVAEAEKIAVANSKKLRVMDITKAFSYRADGHPGPYRNHDPNKQVKRGPDGKPPPQDCLHWCMPGPIDTWNEYLLAMLKQEL